MAGDVERARHQFRSALNQLHVRIGQHKFEILARMLAKVTVTWNLLPATGPVAAGGDPGRDFKTFPTELPASVEEVGLNGVYERVNRDLRRGSAGSGGPRRP